MVSHTKNKRFKVRFDCMTVMHPCSLKCLVVDDYDDVFLEKCDKNLKIVQVDARQEDREVSLRASE